MDLNDYLKSLNRGEIDALDKAAGTKPIYLRHISRGFRRPSMVLALKLESLTQGVLTARELRPDLPWPGLFPPTPETRHAQRAMP